MLAPSRWNRSTPPSSLSAPSPARESNATARRKLARKGCDLIVANDISRADAGFEVDENAVLFVWPNGEVEELPLLPKTGVAAQLFDRVEKLREGR